MVTRVIMKKKNKYQDLITLLTLLFFMPEQNLKMARFLTNGGRVLAVTSLGNSIEEALKISYKNIDKIHFDGMNYRKDIGFDLM